MARRREWQRHAAQVGRARRLREHEARDLLERARVAEVRGAHLVRVRDRDGLGLGLGLGLG